MSVSVGLWGSDLWDRYDGVVAHVNRGTEELGGGYAKYVRERGEVEREYARALRKLVARHSPKDAKKEKVQETSQVSGFRALLAEVGCQAGQHEVLADTLAKELPLEMAARSKEAARLTKESVREARRLGEEVEKAYRSLDKSKRGYQRAFQEWETAQTAYRRAEADGTVSRNEIGKLRIAADSRQRTSDEQKMQYASQLARTNKHQADYFSNQLPGVLDTLHRIEIERSNYLKQVLGRCIAAEQAIAPIIARCHKESNEIIERISPEEDSRQFAERLKTGNQPPLDFPFEECLPGEEPSRPTNQSQYGTLGRKRSKLNLLSREKGEGEVGLFPRARQIRGQVDDLEAEIVKGNKEIKALQLMVATYTQNPKFGDAKKFQAELDSATHRVQLLESSLHSLNRELAEVTRGLEERKATTAPRLPAALPLLSSPGGSREGSSREGSQGYGTISNCSSSDKESTAGSDSSRLAEDFSSEGGERCIALYSYSGEAESSMGLQEGEEVTVTEGDLGGWTRVRRGRTGEEGYVPTAYLQWLT